MFIYSLQTLLLAEILIEPPLNLALIQWYDFKFQTRPYMYGCPHIKLKELLYRNLKNFNDIKTILI